MDHSDGTFEAVHDIEKIVRAAVDPFHFTNKKNKKPHRAAFHPPAGHSSISAIRFRNVDSDGCKAIGKLFVQDLKHVPPKIYEGLWTLQAACLRQAGATVDETKGEYAHHISIDYGLKRQKNDAWESEQDMLRFNSMVDEIFKCARYFPDRDKDAQHWCGDELTFTECCELPLLPVANAQARGAGESN